MRSTWLGIVLAFAVTDMRALAQPEPSAPLWPPDCTRDMPRDGLLLLDRTIVGGAAAGAQALEVRLQRTSDGAIVAGALVPPEGGEEPLLHWQSDAPLDANTEYKVEARPRTGEDLAEPILSGYFTTGTGFLAPLAFSGRPAVRLLARAPEQPASALAPETVLVRIALPPLTGGLPQRALHVSAAWSELREAERAAGLRGQHAREAEPGETLGFELEAELGDAPSERCLEITARDDLGEELALDPPLCVSLPARSEPPHGEPPPGGEPEADAEDLASDDAAPALHAADDSAMFETLAAWGAGDDATGAPEAGSASGCALSGARAGREWAWLAAILPALLLRRGRRFFAGKY